MFVASRSLGSAERNVWSKTTTCSAPVTRRIGEFQLVR
jgi:hypothetical protein